jgi:hypothetical protein
LAWLKEEIGTSGLPKQYAAIADKLAQKNWWSSLRESSINITPDIKNKPVCNSWSITNFENRWIPLVEPRFAQG